VLFIPAYHFLELLETNQKFAKSVIDSLWDLLNSQQKLKIKSQNAMLIKEKKLAPTLPNMRILCSIMRMHNNNISINKWVNQLFCTTKNLLITFEASR
jgi:hypothetical protein